MRAGTLMLALMVTPIAALSQNYKPGFNIFSTRQDYEIGRQSAAVVNRQLRTYKDARVSRIGKRLAAHAPGARYPYEFRVVDNNAINAFALPGGFVYINRGALQAARTEDEVAAVIAHEIAHVALRHGTNQASKAYLAQTGLGLIGGLLGGRMNSGLGQVMGAVGGFGLNTVLLKHSRTAEQQADSLGMRTLRRAGYNPRGMISFLQIIQRHSRGRSVGFLSSHPNPSNRIARLEKELGSRSFPSHRAK
ncbi:MAG TPA: M48 family metallopeptidase [Blastocatellia bacterium]|nr:M48 family metallopeptidase [Blastocatellia bacterium]